LNTVAGSLIESIRECSIKFFDRRISNSHAGAGMHCPAPGLYIYVSALKG